MRLENDFTLNFEESIIPIQSTAEKLPNHKKSSLMRIEAATLFVLQRLLALNLQLSPTQNHTPMDGNCLIGQFLTMQMMETGKLGLKKLNKVVYFVMTYFYK